MIIPQTRMLRETLSHIGEYRVGVFREAGGALTWEAVGGSIARWDAAQAVLTDLWEGGYLIAIAPGGRIYDPGTIPSDLPFAVRLSYAGKVLEREVFHPADSLAQEDIREAAEQAKAATRAMLDRIRVMQHYELTRTALDAYSVVQADASAGGRTFTAGDHEKAILAAIAAVAPMIQGLNDPKPGDRVQAWWRDFEGVRHDEKVTVQAVEPAGAHFLDAVCDDGTAVHSINVWRPIPGKGK